MKKSGGFVVPDLDLLFSLHSIILFLFGGVPDALPPAAAAAQIDLMEILRLIPRNLLHCGTSLISGEATSIALEGGLGIHKRKWCRCVSNHI